MRKSLLLAAATLLVALPAVSSASHTPSGNPPRDHAVGGGTTSTDARFAFSAVSDSAGGDAQGHVTWDGPLSDDPEFDDVISATVLCVNAIGNRARIIANVTRFGGAFLPPPPGHVNLFVKDGGGPGGEGDEFLLTAASAILTPPVDCPPPLVTVGEPLVRGNIVVHDGATP